MDNISHQTLPHKLLLNNSFLIWFMIYDIYGLILSRNLISIVEEILYLTDAKTITNCFKGKTTAKTEL